MLNKIILIVVALSFTLSSLAIEKKPDSDTEKKPSEAFGDKKVEKKGEEPSQGENKADENKQSEALRREDQEVLQRHNPFYFAYGVPDSKLQFSFKAPLVRDVPFFIAYTQQMFWNLREDSKPFKDSTYNPELIYRWTIKDFMIDSIDFAFWSHMSNGKKDAESRSLERRYVRFNFDTEYTRWVVRFSAQFQYLDGFDPTNNDIRDYMGPVILTASFIQLYEAWIDKGEFSISLMPGGKYAQHGSQGGYQFAYSFRLGGLDIVPAFYMQYYVGYAETLLNYNQRVNEFRFGFVL
ncbi:MAG: phospholipase A [Bdellovibrionales bacterium]|nr:phospholipase A [Bdellovibrionales bacterium]